jgi:hypothetical protein
MSNYEGVTRGGQWLDDRCNIRSLAKSNGICRTIHQGLYAIRISYECST